jgi:hypothetical protein
LPSTESGNVFETGGAKALPPFQLIKEKRTRVQEYQEQITTTLPASNHLNLGPNKGPKPCLGLN